ncbi:MAG: hypothetical protein E7544_01880 [Ruminococcaceae bacterium]|nr:hypothetical protein [Oscillospiraceae bacterium]
MFEIICCVFLLVNAFVMILFIIAFSDRKHRKLINNVRNALFIEDEAFEDYGDRMGIYPYGDKESPEQDWSTLSEDDTFALNGKSYETLLIFKGDSEKENYIVYTDNSTDVDGKLQLFASIYNPDVSKELIPVDDDDEEWTAIKSVLSYAVEKSCEESTREDNKIECPEGEFSPFITLCFMANALAQDKSKKDPFILAAKGDDTCNEITGVILSGTIDDIEDAFKHIVISIAKQYKAAGLTQNGAFDNLLCIMVDAVNEAYKSRLRHEVEKFFNGDTEEIDIKEYLDEE